MLIKEYRIPLPLTVEEYRIAQLYMIAVSQERERDKEERERLLSRDHINTKAKHRKILNVLKCAGILIRY